MLHRALCEVPDITTISISFTTGFPFKQRAKRDQKLLQVSLSIRFRSLSYGRRKDGKESESESEREREKERKRERE